MRTLRATLAADLMNRRPLKPNEAEALLDYFETVGELARRRVLDDEMLWNQLSLEIRCYWAGRSGYGLSGYVQKKRSSTGDPTWYERAQWLEGAMALQDSRHRGIPVAETLLSDDRIRECLTGETNLEHVLQSPRR